MAERYNVIVIMTDQQRANLFSTEGFPEAITPTLDSMTDNGVGFENAYTSTPICAPARESLLTGRFPRVTGIRTNDAIEQSRYGIDLMQWSRELGYQTALIGKNHSHLTESDVDFYRPYSHDYGPERPGKEEIDRKFNDFMAELAHGVCTEPTPFPLDCQYPVRIVDDTIDWLGSCGSQPFTLWMSLSEPHNPYQVPEPYFDMFPADTMPPVDDAEILESKSYPWRFSKKLIEKHYPNRRDLIARYRSNYLGMLRLIDDQILRLLNFLDEASLSERTILVFLSDHGDFVGEYGLLRKAVPIPECLARIPMIWKGPGIEGGMLSTPIVSIVDVFPTICEALGQEIPI
ncbi:MAG: sulfatase-like hydrolase/transferase [Firmicutes bacterium]|nr:sulfatase-like hydrolase/transferase [Bacillota bacterium]